MAKLPPLTHLETMLDGKLWLYFREGVNPDDPYGWLQIETIRTPCGTATQIAVTEMTGAIQGLGIYRRVEFTIRKEPEGFVLLPTEVKTFHLPLATSFEPEIIAYQIEPEDRDVSRDKVIEYLVKVFSIPEHMIVNFTLAAA